LEVALFPRDLEVSFLPMEAVGDDGNLTLDRLRPIQEVENGYTYFRDGDVTFAKITPCFENGKGALMAGLAHGIGFGTTELTVARPVSGKMSSAYLYWIFRSPNFRSEGEASMYGAGGQKRVPDDFVRDLLWAVPPELERERIATFLDRETAKIDALIAEQEKLLALLAEKRQATISHAVTRGLDPNVPMKDSGIPWLGEVPAHWRVAPLKYLVSLRSGGTPSKENLDYWDGTVPWASAKDLKCEYLEDTSDHLTQLAIDSGAASLLPAGVILVVVRGMILARAFPVVETRVPMAINQDLKALLPNQGMHASYLAWLLRGTAAESLQRLDEAGHGTKALRMDAWTSLALPVPPEDEQREIVAALLAKTKAIDDLAAESTEVIGLLKERRGALISAAVTGKIDVRGEVAEVTE
jgi:type I restriction enzyme S subunit